MDVYCRGKYECGCGHGLCVLTYMYTESLFTCDCENGYVEKESVCVDLDECALHTDQCEKFCTNTQGDYTCHCLQGYHLDRDRHSCPDTDECDWHMDQCGEHRCVNTYGDYTCDCQKGYDLDEDRHSCHDIDECDLHTDQCGEHRCVNTHSDYTCGCLKGYYLNEDRHSCHDTDECLDNNGGCEHCENLVGSYRCYCPDGYKLNEGTYCDDLDECADIPLHNCTGVNMTCINIPQTFTCGCTEGYTYQQESHTCLDMNECLTGQHDCDHNCTNFIGGYTCYCLGGYKLDGHLCVKLDSVSSTPVTVAVVIITLVASSLPVIGVAIFLYYRRRRRHKHDTTTTHNFSPPEHAYYNVRTGQIVPLESPDSLYANVMQLDTNIATARSGKADSDHITTHTGKADSDHITTHTGKADRDHITTHTGKPESESSPPIDQASTSSVCTEATYCNVSQSRHTIQVRHLLSTLERMREDNEFAMEFKAIPFGKQKSCAAAERKGIRHKLRFKNILPYDHSRVVLTSERQDHLSDFINANFIHGYQGENKYIATQAPTKTTVDDFWRMVWQQESHLIIMLTECDEHGKDKSAEYWLRDRDVQFTEITVTTVHTDKYPDFVIRKLLIRKDGETRHITHYQFTAWPDKGVPVNGSAILQFHHHIQKHQENGKFPIVVHCSAGVGRTGTYIALDYLLEQAESERKVDVCACVNLLRQNRMDMVQTLDQYIFIYTTLAEKLHLGETVIPCSEFMDKINSLRESKLVSGHTAIQQQFEYLQRLCKAPHSVLKDAQNSDNVGKNRNMDIRPVDKYSVWLAQNKYFRSQYINAVRVEGFDRDVCFYVTQMPLSHTVVDFWRLVKDFDVTTIVMLNQLNEQESGHYFTMNSSLDVRPFKIQCDADENDITNDVITNTLQLTYNEKLHKTVKHISLNSWKDGHRLPDDCAGLLALYQEFQRQREVTSHGSILVHCLEGAEKSGLFCAICLLLHKLNIDQVVDVFNSVKSTRKSRPQFVSSIEQYDFLYKIAEEYMKSFSVYANFK